LDGEVGPAQVLPPRLYDKQLLRLLNRVSTEVAPQYDAVFPQQTLAEVTISLKDGRRFDSGPVEALWEPPDRLPGDGNWSKNFYGLPDRLLEKIMQWLPLISFGILNTALRFVHCWSGAPHCRD
jgi:hypothetical protein